MGAALGPSEVCRVPTELMKGKSHLERSRAIRGVSREVSGKGNDIFSPTFPT